MEGGKYIVRNFLAHSSHVITHPSKNDVNPSSILFVSVNGSNPKRKSSVGMLLSTPLYLIIGDLEGLPQVNQRVLAWETIELSRVMNHWDKCWLQLKVCGSSCDFVRQRMMFINPMLEVKNSCSVSSDGGGFIGSFASLLPWKLFFLF